jgi:hypothetical protein
MTQRIKVSNNGIAELCVQKNSSHDLELLGTDELSKKDIFVRSAFENNTIDRNTSNFNQNFNDGDHFLYMVQLQSQECKVIVAEVGVGLLSNECKTIKRERPLYTINNGGSFVPSTNGPMNFINDLDGTYLIAKNYTPVNLAELFIQGHSVIASSDKEFAPFPVAMEENSLLGRRKDLIESISINEISKEVQDSITSYTKQLILKSPQMNVKKIKTKQLILDSISEPDEKAGTLYFDKESKRLKFFNGKEWGEIKTE